MNDNAIAHIATISATWWRNQVSEFYNDPMYRPKLQIDVFQEKLEEVILRILKTKNTSILEIKTENTPDKEIQHCLTEAMLPDKCVPKFTKMVITISLTEVAILIKSGDKPMVNLFQETRATKIQLS